MITVGRRRVGMMGLSLVATLASGCDEKKRHRTRLDDGETARATRLVTLGYVPVDKEVPAAEVVGALKAKLARARLSDATVVRAVGDRIEVDVLGENVVVIADVKEVIATGRLSVAKVATSPDPLAALSSSGGLPPLTSIDTRTTKSPTVVVLFPKPSAGEAKARHAEIRAFIDKATGARVPVVFGCDDEACEKQRSYVLAEEPSELHVVVAKAVTDPQSQAPEVMVELSGESAAAFAEVTKRCLGEPMAMMLDDEVLMAPVVQGVIAGGSARITMGADSRTMKDAERLARRISGAGGPALELATETR